MTATNSTTPLLQAMQAVQAVSVDALVDGPACTLSTDPANPSPLSSVEQTVYLVSEKEVEHKHKKQNLEIQLLEEQLKLIKEQTETQKSIQKAMPVIEQ